MPRKVRIKYHYLYKTTNTITKEFYIGVHSTYNLEDGYLGSGTKLWRRIQKYGRENFVKEILEFFENAELKFLKEKEIVNEQFLQDPLCMNLKEGGSGGFSSKEHLKKAVDASVTWLKESWTKKEYREKQINAIRKSNLKRKEEGKWKPLDWTGRKHKSETIDKLKKSKNIGTQNSQYGTCWVTNGIDVKKIKRSELKYWNDLGWRSGRK